MKTYFSDLFSDKSGMNCNMMDGGFIDAAGGRSMRLVHNSKKKHPDYPLVPVTDEFELEEYFATYIMGSS